ncbi:MAG: hypothetical protein IJ875_02080 [Solobacterium sp.]|nr:hypothetical protein [Solobacterium sp.]
MAKGEVILSFQQFDLLDNSCSDARKIRGYLQDDTLIYREDGYEHFVCFSEKEVILKRKGEFGSLVKLSLDGIQDTIIYSPYGEMVYKSKLLAMDKARNSWSVTYQIYAEEDVLTHQRLVWGIEYLQ